MKGQKSQPSSINPMKSSSILKSSMKKEFIASVTNQSNEDKKDITQIYPDSSPNQILKKFKNYLPARQHASEKKEVFQYQNKVVLNDLESKMVDVDDFLPKINPTRVVQRKALEVKQVQPMMQRISQAQEFKKQPLRRIETDLQMYKEIFVNPRQQILVDLQKKQQNVDELLQDEVEKVKRLKKSKIKRSESIEKINSTRGGSNANIQNMSQINPQIGQVSQGSHKKLAQSVVGSLQQNLEETNHKKDQKSQLNMSQEIQNLNLNTQQQDEQQIKDKPEGKKPGEASFFDQQIQVQPPDMSSMNAAAALKENSTGYPRSIPIMQSFQNTSAKDIRDLLMKAKAGMQAGDLQKEAHLTFILGMVHEQNKNFKQTVRFYKKFLTCAKLLEDKIGMALAANRLGVNYYNQKSFKKSLEYNLQNLQLSDYENQYAAFYNIGICYRKIGKVEQSLEFFFKALEWAQNREEIESECLAFGQIGVDFIELGQYDQALDHLAKCYDLTLKIKNSKLQLDCLLLIIKISTQTSEQNFENIINILKDAYNCAKIIDDKKIISLCLCNMGVLQGKLKFNQYMLDQQQQDQQKINLNANEEF